MKLVVVESPAKANTIEKYLGTDYKVLASVGHVRNLIRKPEGIDPKNNFKMTWQIPNRAKKNIDAIKTALKDADELILATDPDREGEAISWHIYDILSSRKALENITIKRVVFNEITKSKIIDAFARPRQIDPDLVDAYFSRASLDHLVGFNLSPVLWKKLPRVAKSAGRVQSVAVRLIAERDKEIKSFKPEEFWTIDVSFNTQSNSTFNAQLTHIDNRKLEKFGIATKFDADMAAEKIAGSNYSVESIESKRVKRNPYPPFTTSTLQQEASRKLGFNATKTMEVAQSLYEGRNAGVGLITYMRTDGVQMGAEAISIARTFIKSNYGENYTPNSPRVYKTKAKNSQEAHEAIRPTEFSKKPSDISEKVNSQELRLYDLIWKRAIASQMSSAELDQTSVIVNAHNESTKLRATGSIIAFDGYLKVYQELESSSEEQQGTKYLPKLTENEALKRVETLQTQHFTQPPPRYNEASLVKKMEELGIGRPSTYASIMKVIVDREYVTLEKRRFEATPSGMYLNSFLSHYFSLYVQYNYTAQLEDSLDMISDAKLDRIEFLKSFFNPFEAKIEESEKFPILEILTNINKDLNSFFFPTESDRRCESCKTGKFELAFGKFGPFARCSNQQDGCKATRQLNQPVDGQLDSLTEPKLLGYDPDSGGPVTLRKGPFGLFVQLDFSEDTNKKPKKASIDSNNPLTEVTLEMALKELSLPRLVGHANEDQGCIIAGRGRFGAYLKHEGTHADRFVSIPKDEDVYEIGENKAQSLVAESYTKRPYPKELGEKDEKLITLHFGPWNQLFIIWGKKNSKNSVKVNIPKKINKDNVTLELAMDLIGKQAERNTKTSKIKKRAVKPKTVKKSSTKKTSA